jgi:hypothetical protein
MEMKRYVILQILLKIIYVRFAQIDCENLTVLDEFKKFLTSFFSAI